MSILTQPLTGAIEKLTHMTNYHVTIEQLNAVMAQLNAAAKKEGLTTAFTDGGDLIASFRQNDLAKTYEHLRDLAEATGKDKETLLKALTISGGVAIGVTVAGMAWREANRRGWTAGVMQTVNRTLIPKLITRHYGKLAGLASELAMAGKVNEIIWIRADNSMLSDSEGQVKLTNDGLVQITRDNQRLVIPFEAITEIEQTLNADGVVQQATLRVKSSE